ncbi:MAG: hypothetical protein RQ722_07825 [Desulfuromonadales bacterium]|nr:hypothetical protein [Desulfuromonadales bacterium]
MENHEHFRKLERMYVTAPINEFYQPNLKVSAGGVELEILVQEKFYNAADRYCQLNTLPFSMEE